MALALFLGGLIVGLVVLAVLAIIVIAIIMYFVGLYNSLVTFKNNIDRSFSNIDVLLKQRHDELPKLIETCKGFLLVLHVTLASRHRGPHGLYARHHAGGKGSGG